MTVGRNLKEVMELVLKVLGGGEEDTTQEDHPGNALRWCPEQWAQETTSVRLSELGSPQSLHCREIKPVNPKGNQP